MSDTVHDARQYRVTGIDIRHNGQLIRDGQIVDLADSDAAKLAPYLTAINQPDDAPVKPSRKTVKEIKDVV